jgi:hypothetical protein
MSETNESEQAAEMTGVPAQLAGDSPELVVDVRTSAVRW